MNDNLANIYLPAGTLLNQGQYEILKLLGHGGFGITYLAEDTRLKKNVAIKEYFPHGYAQRQPGSGTVQPYSGERNEFYAYGLERYLEEAQTLAQFNHYPGIVSVYYFFEENATAYMVMEYLEGQTVEQWLKKLGEQVEWDQAISIIKPVVETLELLHQRGIIHRDISPDNIYLCTDHQVKMLDFGAARYAMGEHNQSLSVILKHGYAPAEQYTSRGNQGPWTDVYAVAATLFRMVTGQTLPDVTERMEEDSVSALISSSGAVPDECESVLTRALAVKSAERYQKMTDFKTALLAVSGADGLNESLTIPGIEIADSSDPERFSQSAPTLDQASMKTVPQKPGGRTDHADSEHTVQASSEAHYLGENGAYRKKRPKWLAAAAGILVLLVAIAVIVYMNRGAGNDSPAVQSTAPTKIGEDLCRDFAVDGDWLYYGSTSDGTKLHRIKTDGSSRQKLNDNESFNVTVADDWIYYTSPYNQGFKVYRIKTDGSGQQSLFDDQFNTMVLNGDQIYYSRENESAGIYLIQKDGSGRQQLSDDTAADMVVSGEKIYYISRSDGSKMYQITTDGSERLKLGDDQCKEIAVSGNWLYYSNASDSGKLYRIKMDGSSRQKLCDDEGIYITIAGDWLYYSNKSDECKLYRIKTEGSERQKLNDDWSGNIAVAGDWAYYTNGYVGRLCRVKI